MSRSSKSLFMLAGVACLALPAPGQALRTNVATISVGLVRGIPGSSVTVPLSLSHTGLVSAAQLDVSYLPSKLTASPLQNAALPNNTVLRSRQVAPGQHRLLVYTRDLTLLHTNVALGRLPFSVPPGDLAGGGQLRITNALASTAGAVRATPLSLIHGGVLVGPVFSGIDGIVDLFLTVQSNRAYVIQATTDFLDWINLSTNFPVQDYIVFKDETAPQFSLRFYRAVPVGTAAERQIGELQLQQGGIIAFSYSSTPGQTFVLQASTDLTSWSSIGTNLAASGTVAFTNLMTPSYPQRFFRVLEAP